MLSEVVTTNVITFEKSLKDHEAMVRVDSIEKTNVSEMNSNIDLKFEKMVDENKSVETEPVYNSNLRYILACLVVVLFIVLTNIKRVRLG